MPNNRIFAGVDVSCGSVSVAILDELPDDIKRFSKRYKLLKFKPSQVHELLGLAFTHAVIEPTGGHYSRFWAEKLKAAGKEVLWVGHWEVASYRESLKVFDKTDKLDAIALACYGLERYGRSHFFLSERIEIARKLRELYLELEFFNRLRTPIINRLRQQLAHECPELSDRNVSEPWLSGPAGLWKAIAGNPTPKWQKEIEASVGLGIGRFSHELANQLIQLRKAEQMIETELELLLKAEEFKQYLDAMEPFHFGRVLEVAILSSIFPMERFRGRDNPLGAFKLSLGLAQTWVESGNYTGWTAGGSSTLRTALWRWAYAIIPNGLKSGKFVAVSPELSALRDYYLNGSMTYEKTVAGGIELTHHSPGKGNQRLMRCCRRAVTMLYRKLRPLI